MAHPFPHRYSTELIWPGEGAASLLASGRPDIEGGAPPEFDGREEWWSPEHLLLAALNLCLQTTFQAIARRARVPVLGYESRAEAVLDRTAEGLGFTAFALEVRVSVPPEHAETALALVEKAKKHCLVAGALRADVRLDVAVSALKPDMAAAR
jgi:organic hydroperoxide reductase OsmC/OhrA